MIIKFKHNIIYNSIFLGIWNMDIYKSYFRQKYKWYNRSIYHRSRCIYLYVSIYIHFTNSLPAKGAITDPTLAQKEENDIPEFLKIMFVNFFCKKKLLRTNLFFDFVWYVLFGTEKFFVQKSFWEKLSTAIQKIISKSLFGTPCM